MVAVSGCDLCGDFPVRLHARCHPTAPLRVETPSPTEVVFYCYLPECNREITRLRLAAQADPAVLSANLAGRGAWEVRCKCGQYRMQGASPQTWWCGSSGIKHSFESCGPYEPGA